MSLRLTDILFITEEAGRMADTVTLRREKLTPGRRVAEICGGVVIQHTDGSTVEQIPDTSLREFRLALTRASIEYQFVSGSIEILEPAHPSSS